VSAPETLVSRFFANADRLGPRPFTRFHAGGAWVPVGWRGAARLVRDLASGLVALGHRKGDTLGVLAATRWEWALADLANLCAGGVTVGVYPTLTAEQSAYVIAHADTRFLVVENAKQLAKVEAVRQELPRLETLILIDPTGVAPARDRMSLADLLARGRAARQDVDARAAQIRLEDPAILIYTSGTTGPPKGAVLSHGNLVAAMHAFDALPIDDADVGFSFLPLAHALQRAVNFRGLWTGTPGSFARSLDTIADDLKTCRPSLVAAVPRIFEKVYARINAQAAAGSPAKQKIFHWALGVGQAVSHLRQAHEPVPPRLELEHRLARVLVFDKLRAGLGGRIRLFITGGAPIAKEILEFFDAADISILEGWGMTETFSAGTANLPGATRFGSIGRPLAGIDLRLDGDGEILVRGQNVFSGYYKDEAATREAFTADGYFRTGDIGKVDADGYYYIVDRKKDLIITAAGKNVAPQNIENLIKTDPRISQVMVVGDRKNYLVALISVAPEARAGGAEAELAQIVQAIVDKKNEDLASFERIKKFRLLPEDLSQEAGELTPTLKVKRKVVSAKYQHLIDEMYAEPRSAQGAA